MGALVLSSGESETTEGKDVFRSLQALPKEPCSASSSLEVFSTDPGMAVPMEIPQSPRSRNDEFAKSSQCNWGGVNSYFLWAMGQAEQDQILRDMQTRGLKMMRIFVSTVPQNFKSTTSQFVPFLEPRLGEYDFTALELINKFMVKVKEYGVKLAIALHDRYELGCWYCDGYQKYLGLTCLAGQPCGPLHLSCACEIFEEGLFHSFAVVLVHAYVVSSLCLAGNEAHMQIEGNVWVHLCRGASLAKDQPGFHL